MGEGAGEGKMGARRGRMGSGGDEVAGRFGRRAKGGKKQPGSVGIDGPREEGEEAVGDVGRGSGE